MPAPVSTVMCVNYLITVKSIN